MKAIGTLALFAFIALPIAATAQVEPARTGHFFPYFADGDGFQSHLFVTTVSGAANRCMLTLRGQDLDNVVFRANNAVTPAESGVAIDMGETEGGLILTSSGEGSLTFGYANLDCSEPVSARVLISLKNGSAPVSLTTLESASPGMSFWIPVLPQYGRLTLVFSNHGDRDAVCAVELEDESGANIGGNDVNVPARGTALQLLNELIPIPVGFDAGRTRLSCNRNIAALGLLRNGPISTALPAIAPDDDSATPTHILPLVADGGGFRSRLLLTNLAESGNRCTIGLRGDGLDAGRFDMPADATATATSLALDLAGGGQISLPSVGANALVFGYATVECEGSVAAQNLLTADAAGNLAGTAAISSAQSASGMEFPFLPELGQLALVLNNSAESAASCAAVLSGGEATSGQTGLVGIPGRSTAVRFINDLFDFPADFPGGVARLRCDGDVTAISIPHSGAVFAAIPPTVLSIEAFDPGINDGAMVVSVPDANLRSLLAEALGKEPGEPIHDIELEELDRLDASNAGIENLDGLQYATGLTVLTLGPGAWDAVNGYVNSNRVSDLSPIFGLKNLIDLRLEFAGFSGPIPPEIGQLESLQFLGMEGNQFSGPIPRELGQLSRLEHLILWGNRLSGPIPPEIGQLSLLRTLSLEGNQLGSPIPPEIGRLENLRFLRLGENRFSGRIPRELGQLSLLEGLSLWGNRLIGSIPPEIGQLSLLKELSLWGNRLSGPIPPEIGRLESLRSLRLAENHLMTGLLPWALRDRIASGELTIDITLTMITGFGQPPKRTRSSSYSGNPEDNGNASHRSIAYFQGPLMLERKPGGAPAEFQTPILGRWAMLAVSVLHEVQNSPSVITRVLNPDNLVLNGNLAEAANPVTQSAGDEKWVTEYYFDMPGELFHAGNRIEHVIDPENELAETNEDDNVWEAFVIYGSNPPKFRVSFIPIQLAHVEDRWYEGLHFDPDGLMSANLAYLPIADDFEARVGSAFEIHGRIDSDDIVMRELTAHWNLNSELGEFYHGLLPARATRGRALINGRVAFSPVVPYNVVPHELGHNLSLQHPPGCEADFTDENYPYSSGRLGANPGWDVNWRRFASNVDDSLRDLMSYCGTAPVFISDYNFRKASQFWLSYGTGISASHASTSTVVTAESVAAQWNAGKSAVEDTRSLALAGSIGAEGIWSLTQAQLSKKSPRPPTVEGEFTLILLDSAGVRIYSEPLPVMEIHHGNISLWAARTPMPLRRPAREILILDARGNEALRQPLPILD